MRVSVYAIVSLEDLRTHDDFFVAIKEASSIEELTRLAKEYDDGVGIILERKKFLEDEIDRMYKEKEQLDRDYPFYGDIKGSITFEIGRLILERPGRSEALPPPSPLRTVRASFPAYSSSPL